MIYDMNLIEVSYLTQVFKSYRLSY